MVEAATTADALAFHRRRSLPLTIADMGTARLDGPELIRAVRDARPLAQFLMLSRGDSVAAAVAALKAGADDLLLKPVDRAELVQRVHQVWSASSAQQTNQRLEQDLRRQYDFSEIIGRSPKILHVLAMAGRVARRETTVLITGESGTGKELMARAIHNNSHRAAGPLVAINCAAIPEPLLESELFGYRKGAFTGADADKGGLLATAEGGTLFLDEVAELPLATQAKLLRFVQESTYYPVGSAAPCRGDVRIISATNAPLQELAEAGSFRRDLYYRLSVFPLHLPPLRERLEDIVPLAEHFLSQLASKSGGLRIPGLSREVVHYLTARSWRGNVREMQSAIERAVILSEGSLLTSADFRRLEVAAENPAPRSHFDLPDRGVNLPDLNRRLILEAMERTHDNIAAAARLLGLTRPSLRYRLKKYRVTGH